MPSLGGGKMEQTVFNYPDEKTSTEVIDLIFSGKLEEAYGILSGFYHVPEVMVICDAEKFHEDWANADLSSQKADAYYQYKYDHYHDLSSNYVNFRFEIYRKLPHLALHEFYHHLERIFGLRGVKIGAEQTAESWAEWFIRSAGDIGRVVLVYSFWDIKYAMRVVRLLKAVKNGAGKSRVKELKKKTAGIITRKDVVFSRTEKKYQLTPTGEKMLEYGTTYFTAYKAWKNGKQVE